MKTLRLLLLPFSFIYGMITSIRNWLYDRGSLKAYVIPNKSIVIGNITVGGTGKSPMTIYITQLLADFNPAILSRGYGRSTKGPRLAGDGDNTSTIGDEPFMYRKRFGNSVPVVVAEERKLGVELLNSEFDNPLILLDDAFQHRKVKAGFQLLLMTYDNPVFNDFPFPAGNLRENRNGIKRADVIVVTKCPDKVDEQTKTNCQKRLDFPADKIFFSAISYGHLIPISGNLPEGVSVILLVTGIANPEPLQKHLEKTYTVIPMKFPDHHAFSVKDMQEIHRKFATFAPRQCAIVTTEKDAVRLSGLTDKNLLQQAPWLYQTMQLSIDRQEDFNELLVNYVTTTNAGSR